MNLWRNAVFYNENASICPPRVPSFPPLLFSLWGNKLSFSLSFLLNYRFLKLACIVVCEILFSLFHSFFTANESLMCQISTHFIQLSKFMIWCFLITILINLGCQLFQHHLGHKCVLLICIVFYSVSVTFNRPTCWAPELAKLQICCFLQCARCYFCVSRASIFVTSKCSFSQNAVFCNELKAPQSQNLRFFQFLLLAYLSESAWNANRCQKWCQNGRHHGANWHRSGEWNSEVSTRFKSKVELSIG